MTTTNALCLESIQQHVLEQYPHDVKDFLKFEDAKTSYQLLKSLTIKKICLLLIDLPTFAVTNILSEFPIEKQVRIIENLGTDKAIDVIKLLDPALSQQIIEQVKEPLAKLFMQALTYTSDSAGSLMDRNILRFNEHMTVNGAIKQLKKFSHHHFRVIYITDENGKLTHYVPIQDLLFAKQQEKLEDIQKNILAFVYETDPQSEIEERLDRFKLTDLPVIDVEGKLLGVIRYRTLYTQIKEAALRDMQSMVGASPEEKALSKVRTVVTKRLPWLQINLLTAFLAAFVVGLFESTIAKYTALAILLPIVAGQSGNTGAQALAVTMRGLVLKEVFGFQWRRIVIKEASAALINGLVVAITTAVCVYLWSFSLGLTTIIFSSMILSMIMAAIAGALTPIALNYFGLDPAQSSSIILTTITDVTGFFCFLGIANYLITRMPM